MSKAFVKGKHIIDSATFTYDLEMVVLPPDSCVDSVDVI